MSTAPWLRRWILACLSLWLAQANPALGQSGPVGFRLTTADVNRFIVPPLSPDADERAMIRQHHETWLIASEVLQRIHIAISLWRQSNSIGVFDASGPDAAYHQRRMHHQWTMLRDATFLARDLEQQFFDDLANLLPDKSELIESLWHQHVWRRVSRGTMFHGDVAAVELDVRAMLDKAAPDWSAHPDVASLVRHYETKRHVLIRDCEDWSWQAGIVSSRLQREYLEAKRNQTPDLPARIRACVDHLLQTHRHLMRIREYNLHIFNALLPMLSAPERAAVESLAEPVINRPFFIASEETERLLMQIRGRRDLSETDRAALEALVERIMADRRKAVKVMRPLYEKILTEDVQRALLTGSYEKPADVPSTEWVWPDDVLAFEAKREAWNETQAAHAEALRILIDERPAIGERPAPADLEGIVSRQWNTEELAEPRVSKASIDAFVRHMFPDNSAMSMVIDSAWSELRIGLAQGAATYLKELTAIQAERLRRIDSPDAPDPLSYRQTGLNIRSTELRFRLESQFEEQIARLLSGSVEARWRQLFMALRRREVLSRLQHGRTPQFFDVIAIAESIGPAFTEHPEVQPLLDEFAAHFDLIARKKAEHQLVEMRFRMRQHDASLPPLDRGGVIDHSARLQEQAKALDQSLEQLCRNTVNAIQPLLNNDTAERFRLAVLAARNPKLHARNPIQILVDEADLHGVSLGEHDAAIRERAAALTALDLRMLEQILAAHDRWSVPELVEARRKQAAEFRDAGRSQDAFEIMRGNHPAEPYMKQRFEASEAACRDVRAMLGEEFVQSLPPAMRLVLIQP